MIHIIYVLSYRGDTGKTGTRERDGKSNEMAAYAQKGNGLV
jgi:hypothetical protein